MTTRWTLGATSALLAACLAAPAPALARYTLLCESQGERYNYCSADTNGGVRLLDRQSRRPCNKGRDWGSDGGGVWVTNGCRATFEIGRDGGSSDAGKAIAIAGGLAILGAIVANANKDDNNYNPPNYDPGSPNVPGWAIGSFRGRNVGNRRDETVRIDPNGNATLYWPGGQQSGWFDGYNLSFRNYNTSVEPVGGGIRIGGAFYRRL